MSRSYLHKKDEMDWDGGGGVGRNWKAVTVEA